MRYILIFVFAIIVCGCTKEETAQITFEDKMKSKCGNYLKERLKDPDSYQSKGWVIKKIPYADYQKTKMKYPDYDYKF